MLTYYLPYFNDSTVYSIDNVRLKFRLMHDTDMPALLDFLGSHVSSEYFMSTRSYTYRHLFTFHLVGSTFTVMLDLVGDASRSMEGIIDFNPNKVLGDVVLADGFVKARAVPFEPDSHDILAGNRKVFWDVFSYLYGHSKRFELLRYDLAIDIGVNRTEVQLLKDSRKYSQFRKSAEDLTEYLGSRSSGGYVKVYNKTLESELDYPCTRVEITMDSLEYSDLVKKLPRLVMHREINVDGDVLLQLLSRLPADEFNMYYQRLGYRLKKKYEPLIVQDLFTVPEHVFFKISQVAASFTEYHRTTSTD